jgi:hypothetical protein
MCITPAPGGRHAAAPESLAISRAVGVEVAQAHQVGAALPRRGGVN